MSNIFPDTAGKNESTWMINIRNSQADFTVALTETGRTLGDAARGVEGTQRIGDNAVCELGSKFNPWHNMPPRHHLVQFGCSLSITRMAQALHTWAILHLRPKYAAVRSDTDEVRNDSQTFELCWGGPQHPRSKENMVNNYTPRNSVT